MYVNYFNHNDDDKNLLSRRFRNGHNGHSEEHRQEMREIAKQVCKEEFALFRDQIEELMAQAYRQAINDVLEALEYDIESVVSIAIDGCKDVFYDKKVQKYLSDQIIKELHKKLDNKHFRK